jgi:lactoylglutathione lyase
MLDIENVNHVGIRVSEKARSIEFYQRLGFELKSDVGFEKGHPVIMRHACGVVLNLLGPTTEKEDSNVLMDIPEKHPGITHVALTISSLEQAREFLQENNIEITGSFSFGNMSALFIRDPDRSVIELDCYTSDEEHTNSGDYSSHPA